MKAWEQKYQEWISDFYHGELLFFAGFILILFRGMWLSTMFSQNRMLSLLSIPVAALLIGLKILLFDHYPVKQFLLLGMALICTLFSCYFSHTVNAFLMVLLVLGSKNIKFEKILKVYLVIIGSLMILAFLSSLVDVIENLQYEQEHRRLRNAFGSIYPTDFASHIFYYITIIFYLKKDGLRCVHYMVAAGLAVLIYYFCDTRLDSASILLLIVFYWLGYEVENSSFISRNIKSIWDDTWKKIRVFLVPILAVVSIMSTVLYRENNVFWMWLDKLLSNRLSLGKNAYLKSGIQWLGQNIEMVGFGGTTEIVSNYNFVDCSYVHVLLVNGVLFLTVLLILYVFCGRKNSNNLYFSYVIAVVAINCMIAHHLLQVEYNVWLLSLLSIDSCTEGKEKNNGGYYSYKDND